MKKPGSILEFTAERNAEVMRAYRKALRHPDITSLPTITDYIVRQPASRFWVSEERACAVVSKILRGEKPLSTMRGPKRRMYEEICKRVMIKRSLRPNSTLTDLVAEVIYEAAPEFYMEPLTARDIIYKERNKKHAH